MNTVRPITLKTMNNTTSLELQAKTKYTIQNKPGQELLSAHEYMIQRHMEKLLLNKKNENN